VNKKVKKEWYVSKVDVTIVDGKPVATETILTRADTERPARASYQRFQRIGIENLCLCPPNPKRYKRLLREQRKRHKDRKMTVADVAEIVAEFDS
tara:strand:+ start:272 stop:556 length:285 start_codon:yes stop_codon:yes gene_type:complete